MSLDRGGVSSCIDQWLCKTWSFGSAAVELSGASCPAQTAVATHSQMAAAAQTSTDLVSHSASLVRLLRSDWMLLCGVTNARSKGPGVHLAMRACVPGMCIAMRVCLRVRTCEPIGTPRLDLLAWR